MGNPQLAYAYETAMNPTNRRLPGLLSQICSD
jgi:hypothetical protein